MKSIQTEKSLKQNVREICIYIPDNGITHYFKTCALQETYYLNFDIYVDYKKEKKITNK